MATAAAQKALRETPRALEMGFIKGPGTVEVLDEEDEILR